MGCGGIHREAAAQRTDQAEALQPGNDEDDALVLVLQDVGLFLVMQPILSLSSPYDSLNFEILLRLRDELGKMIDEGARRVRWSLDVDPQEF